jgi:hypothetical protein
MMYGVRAVLVYFICLSLLAAPLRAGTSDLGDRLKDPATYGGVIGSLAGSVVATGLAGALPGGLFAKAVIGMAGGFVGWEIGSLNFLQTDWRRLLAKSAVAGVAYFGAQSLLGAHGLFGSSVAFVASIGAAVMAEKIVDRLRKPDPDDDLAARHEAWRKAVEDVLQSPDADRLSTLRARESALRDAR